MLNPLLSETNGDLSEIFNGSYDLERHLEDYEQDDLSPENFVQDVDSSTDGAQQEPAEKILKLTVGKVSTPRVRTQSQGLAVLGKSLAEFGNQQAKNLATATKKANEQYDEYVKLMAEQRSLDRAHELAMFKMLLESHRPAPVHPILSAAGSAFNLFVPSIIAPPPTLSTPLQNQILVLFLIHRRQFFNTKTKQFSILYICTLEG